MKKRKAHDEGMQRQAALVAFTAFFELKHVILVDDDIDIFDMNDVMWAMTTRYQGDMDTMFLPAIRGHALDPSATPEFNQLLRRPGHHLQDHLRLHGALGARGALRAARSSWTWTWRSTTSSSAGARRPRGAQSAVSEGGRVILAALSHCC